MEILRSIGAVVAGYAVMVVLVMVSFAAGARFFRMAPTRAGGDGMTPSKGYLTFNLVSGLIAAVVGGWVTGCIAQRNMMLHAIALALLVAAMGVLSARRPQPGQPAWYPWVITLIGLSGALIGGELCVIGL
ncbi:MAG: hypothetical protein JSR45_04670 [Proteobacteria bacterium]|nr:hypothetical protein [Pseudomonadota bacterium]